MTTTHPHGSRGAPDRGFTLVELLIVVVVLGILATVAVFAVRGITDHGQASACASENQVLGRAVEVYLAESSSTVLPATGSGAERYETTLVAAGYMRSTSDLYDVAADGSLIAATGSPC